MAKYIDTAKASFLAGLSSSLRLVPRVLVTVIVVVVIYKLYFQYSRSEDVRAWLEQSITNLKVWQFILLVWFISLITSDVK